MSVLTSCDSLSEATSRFERACTASSEHTALMAFAENSFSKRVFSCSQECRALRFLQSQPGGAPCVARLRDSFGLVGHQCLVLERLRPSLLGLIAESAELQHAEALRQLRGVAFQLLVRVFMSQAGAACDVEAQDLRHRSR